MAIHPSLAPLILSVSISCPPSPFHLLLLFQLCASPSFSMLPQLSLLACCEKQHSKRRRLATTTLHYSPCPVRDSTTLFCATCAFRPRLDVAKAVVLLPNPPDTSGKTSQKVYTRSLRNPTLTACIAEILCCIRHKVSCSLVVTCHPVTERICNELRRSCL